MSTSAHNQPRLPKGVPTGGRWQAMTRPEATISLAPERQHLWRGWEDGERSRRLTDAERDLVRAWRRVASGYRHGDCGREGHETLPGCDIVCVSAHGKVPAGPAGAEVAGLIKGRPPWTKSRERSDPEENAVTSLLCQLVMHAVPPPA